MLLNFRPLHRLSLFTPSSSLVFTSVFNKINIWSFWWVLVEYLVNKIVSCTNSFWMLIFEFWCFRIFFVADFGFQRMIYRILDYTQGWHQIFWKYFMCQAIWKQNDYQFSLFFFFTIRFDILEICLGWVSLLQVLFPIPHFAACLGFFTVDRTSEFVPIYWQISNGRKWLTTNAWTYLSVGRMLWKIWDWEWWRMQLIFFLILKKTKKVFSSGIIDLMIHEAHTILFIKVQSIT